MKIGFNSPPSLVSWKSQGGCCSGSSSSWVGVTCNDQSQVIGLKLESFGLTGFVRPEVSKLANLQVLDLYKNTLGGSFPLGLSLLTALTSLSLSHNVITSSIPSEYSTLNQLQFFFMDVNKLTGSLPASMSNVFVQCTAANFRVQANQAMCGTTNSFRGIVTDNTNLGSVCPSKLLLWSTPCMLLHTVLSRGLLVSSHDCVM